MSTGSLIGGALTIPLQPVCAKVPSSPSVVCGQGLPALDSASTGADDTINTPVLPGGITPNLGRVHMRAPMPSPTAMFAKVLFPLLTLAMVGVVSTTPAQARSSASSNTYERQAVNTTNTHRERHGLRRLRDDSCLARYANRQASRMANRHRLYHQDLSPIMRECNLSGVGENVAYGYRSGRSVVSDGWMKSDGHRKNILTGKFRVIAVGAAQDDTGRWYTAQVLGRR